MKKVLIYFFSILMILGGIFHIIKPEFYSEMIPHFISQHFANIAIAVVELVIGITFFTQYKELASLCFCILMIVFLPIHIWDLFKEKPAVGSVDIAIVRLFIQFLVIYSSWWLYKSLKKTSSKITDQS